jgi:uncharacterized protein (DUF4415 family)
MEEAKRGGVRPNSGRPETDRKCAVTIRISQESLDKFNRLTKNKSEYIDQLIREQPEP